MRPLPSSVAHFVGGEGTFPSSKVPSSSRVFGSDLTLPLSMNFSSSATSHSRPNYPFSPNQDVLSGRGEYYKRNNRFYRQLVTDYFPAYDASKDNNEKRAIAAEVVEIVHKQGGRFLDNEGKELSEWSAVHKTMKALKDRRIGRKTQSSTPPRTREPEKNDENDPTPILSVFQMQGLYAQPPECNMSPLDTVSQPSSDATQEKLAFSPPPALFRLCTAQAGNFRGLSGQPKGVCSQPAPVTRVESTRLDCSELSNLPLHSEALMSVESFSLLEDSDALDDQCEALLLAELFAYSSNGHSFDPDMF